MNHQVGIKKNIYDKVNTCWTKVRHVLQQTVWKMASQEFEIPFHQAPYLGCIIIREHSPYQLRSNPQVLRIYLRAVSIQVLPSSNLMGYQFLLLCPLKFQEIETCSYVMANRPLDSEENNLC